MIRKLNTFKGLSPAQKKLLFQALAFSVYAYILFGFFKKQVTFGQPAHGAPSKQQPDSRIRDIAWAIQTVHKYIPWKNVCRHQAYQAKLLCNFYKIPYRIFIGFKKDKEKNEIQAHAWTVAGGRIITGFCNPEEYTVQSIYSN